MTIISTNRISIYIVTVLLVLLVIFIIIRSQQVSVNPISQKEIISAKNIPLHPAVNRYMEFFEAQLDSTNNVGAALTILYKGRTQLTRVYGVKKIGTSDSVNQHTVFRLASVSKGFAGVLACILEKEGTFSLNDEVINYLPGFKLKDSVNTNNLTIENTLSHTSGLVPHAYDNLIEDGVKISLILQQLPAVDISAPPGILYGYQNVMFSLIDTIGVKLTGLSYPELLSKKVFVPLKMRNASANAKIFNRRWGNYAYPHVRRDTSYIALPLNKGYYNIAPAAGVNASIDDMNKWLMALLGNKSEIIDSTILNKITTPVVLSPLKRRYTRYWDPIEAKHYSLGWRIYHYKGYKIIYHGGYVRGYRAEIAFCPDDEVGIVFLQNSPNRLASMSIPAFFNIWIAHKDSAWTESMTYPIGPTERIIEDSTFNINGFLNFIPEQE